MFKDKREVRCAWTRRHIGKKCGGNQVALCDLGQLGTTLSHSFLNIKQTLSLRSPGAPSSTTWKPLLRAWGLTKNFRRGIHMIGSVLIITTTTTMVLQLMEHLSHAKHFAGIKNKLPCRYHTSYYHGIRPDVVMNIYLHYLIWSLQQPSEAGFYCPHVLESKTDTQRNDQTCRKSHRLRWLSQGRNPDCWHLGPVVVSPWVAYSTGFSGRRQKPCFSKHKERLESKFCVHPNICAYFKWQMRRQLESP